MRKLCPHQLHLVSGGNGGWGFPNDCPYCNEDIDTAASNFTNDYKAFEKRYDAVGFSEGAAIGGAIGSIAGGAIGGIVASNNGANVGAGIGNVVGQFGGRFVQAGFPYDSYFKVKEAAEKVYGLQ